MPFDLAAPTTSEPLNSSQVRRRQSGVCSPGGAELLNQKVHGKPVDFWSIGYRPLLQIIHSAM
jgi:hypothetical protein